MKMMKRFFSSFFSEYLEFIKILNYLGFLKEMEIKDKKVEKQFDHKIKGIN
jgi:saccharopine dehydrogenase-like NADP-dependent oxidoreductase